MAKRALITDGSKIRETRERAGLNQSQFAAICGITQPALSRIENDQRNASPQLLRTIAGQLGVSLDAITHPVPEPVPA